MRQNMIDILVESICRWDRIAQSMECENDSNCLLCVECYACSGCPVYLKSGKECCVGTPYHETNTASSLLLSEELEDYPESPPNIAAVEAEIEFLISLLPEESEEAKKYKI